MIDRPQFRVKYNGRDITNDLSPGFISLSYTDRYEFESDDLEIQVEDVDGLWQNAWYPDKGAKLELEFGYEGRLVPGGTFEIDEIALSGPPDVVSIRAIATGITKELRTERSEGYEKQSLRQIIQKVASRNGLTVKGTIEQIQFNRVTQNRETDVAFLKRLSYDFGYIFSIRGTDLIFYNLLEIDKQSPSLKFTRQDMTRWSFKDTTADKYRKAEAKHLDPQTKVTYFSVEQETGLVKSDTLAIKGRTENKQQADTKAKVALYRANSRQQEGQITLPGTPELVAGNTFSVLGFGKYDGAYVVKESRHTFSRGAGYSTTIDVKRAGNSDAQQDTKSQKNNNYQVYQA